MQFVGKVFSSVSEFYKDINPSTLSGAIDVLVVEDAESGKLTCSPFHVRFGKMHLLRPQEKVVDIMINGKLSEIKMKVGEAGESFFVLPLDNEEVDEEYATSPLVMAVGGGEVEELQLSPQKGRALSDEEIEDKKGLTSDRISRRDADGALSDSELLDKREELAPIIVGKEDDLNVGSPPKYSWMWGDIPHKEVKQNSDTAGHTADTTATTVTAAAPASADVSLVDYLNRPSVFKEYFETFQNTFIITDKRFFKLAKDVTVKDDTSITTDQLLKLINEKMTEIKPNDLSQSVAADFASLFDNSQHVVVLNDSIFFPGSVGFWLLTCKLLFSEIPKLEVVYKKYPNLDPNSLFNQSKKPSAGRSSASSGSWRFWSRHSTGDSSRVINSTASDNNRTSLTNSTASDDNKTSLTRSAPFTENSQLPSIEVAASIPLPPSPSSTATLSSTRDLARTSNNKFRKSLRLPHETLIRLDLQPGANTISFTVTTRLQGTATCNARIFLWKSDSRLIVSDIDGTITKSDALGHLFTFVGRDWTHANIAKLYTDISANGYKFVYLSSRSLGQANVTRGYLKAVEQNKFILPDGPVIMSPDRLLAALRREVVLGIPQEFKIACLKDLQQLFCAAVEPSSSDPINPFYAGFGNRTNDAKAYLAIGIPPPRIFIVNPTGTVSVEPLADRYASSYAQLIELVDSMFPPVRKTTEPVEEPFNDFWFWKRPVSLAPLVPFELKEGAELITWSGPKVGDAALNDGNSGNGDFDAKFSDNSEDEESLVPAYYI